MSPRPKKSIKATPYLMMEIKIYGIVMRGTQYGKQLGFPTANLDRKQFSRLIPRPKLGVYAGTAQKNKSLKIYKAGIVIGPRDARALPKIEAHLIGFSGNLYGQRLELKLMKYLRPFQKYSGEMALKAQIKKDISKVKKLL